MFARSLALILAAVATVNAGDIPADKDCDCYAYLQQKGCKKGGCWDYLRLKGITLEEICCQVGYVNSCYKGSHYGSSYVAPKGVANPDAYDYIDPRLSYCIREAGLDKLGHYYPEYPPGQTYASGDAIPYDVQGVGYGGGYRPQPCSYSRNYYDYLTCVIATYFDELVQACYCYYRSDVHCECDDCDPELKDDKDEGGKDILIDRYIAWDDPEIVCNQCPKYPAGDKPDDGYGNSKPYGGGYGPNPGYGYDKVLKGEPYDPCQGYCYLIEPFGDGHGGD